jgi:hypothetical protein
MKEEYNFSGGERGKFYHPDIELDLPIYLDSDVSAFLQKLAAEKETDVTTIVNDWIRKNIALVETVIDIQAS